MPSLNRNTILCSALVLTSALSSAITVAKDDEKTITTQEDVSRAESIKITIPAGDVEIVGTAGNNLTAVATASCQKGNQENCNQLLKELNWTKSVGKFTELGLAPVGIKRFDDVTTKVKISVPKDKKLNVTLTAGELRMDGTSACLDADVNAGAIKINLKESLIASAELNAKVGNVNLKTAKGEQLEGNRALLVGSTLLWNTGVGSCKATAKVLAGDIQLILN